MVRAVTERLVGAEPGARPDDEGGEPWLPLDSPARQVHADIAMLIGGLRALLLQSLHPVAMQAVRDQAGFRVDPWGRFQRTARFVGATTYGSADRALEQIEHVRRIHTRVTGRMPDGTPYRADDPRLLMWVHIAEADSFLAANRAYAAEPLARSEVDRYIADLGRTGEALGVLNPPRTQDQLTAQLAAYRPELRGGEPARDAARLLLWDPPITGTARAGYRVLAGGAVATLPAWARSELGVPTSVIMDWTVLRPIARTLMITLDRAFEAEARLHSDEPADAV